MKCVNIISLSTLVLLSCSSVGSTEHPVGTNESRLNRSKTTMEINSSRRTIRTNTDAIRYLENSTSSEVKSSDEESESNESVKKENKESSKTVDPSTIPPQSEMRDDESSNFSVLVLLFALAGIGYLIRKRLINNKMNSGRWIAGAMPLPTDDFDEDEMIHYRKQEMVTISNEDEWGWEDNAKRDLEKGLSGVHHTNGTNIRNELNSALEINLNSYEKKFDSTSGLKRPSTSYIRGTSSSSTSSIGTGRADKSVFTASSTNTKPTSNVTASKPYNAESHIDGNDDDDNWDDDDDNWDDHPVATQKVQAPSSVISKSDQNEPSKPTLTTTSAAIPSIEDLLKEQQLSGNAPVITSLQKSVTESKPKPATKTKPKQEEDDIFASMGLSTLPKTSAKTALPVQKTTKVEPSTKPPASSAVTSSLTAAALISPESEDAGSDWGDDSDLNDLLDD